MNLCDSCKRTDCTWVAQGVQMSACTWHQPITRADLAARDAEIAKADPFARTWRDFCAGWAAARNSPAQDRSEADYIERDAAADRWESALRQSKVIVATEGAKL